MDSSNVKRILKANAAVTSLKLMVPRLYPIWTADSLWLFHAADKRANIWQCMAAAHCIMSKLHVDRSWLVSALLQQLLVVGFVVSRSGLRQLASKA